MEEKASSDRFTTFEIGKESKTTTITYLNLELIEEEEEEDGSSVFCKKSILVEGKTKGSKNFGRVICHTDNVDKLYSLCNMKNMSQSPLYLKTNLPMLHGEKGSFIFANQMAINYHLHSHFNKNGINNCWKLYCLLLYGRFSCMMRSDNSRFFHIV